MNENKRKKGGLSMLEDKKKVLVIGVVGIVVIMIGIVYWGIGKEKREYVEFEDEMLEEGSTNEIENKMEEKIEEIVVHVSGQVVNVGIVTLKEGARITDAIQAAGGTTEEADLEKVNLAYVLEDAQKVYIPSKKEKEDNMYILEGSGDAGIVSSDSTKTSKKEEKIMININTAKEEELQKLDGIGISTATKIINYRKENGKFNTIEDIKNVSGIGESKFNKIKDKIYVK